MNVIQYAIDFEQLAVQSFHSPAHIAVQIFLNRSGDELPSLLGAEDNVI
jgi:hypothetical protein